MTWAKFGTDFWRKLAHAGYSDAAVRTHAEAIAYLYEVAEETTGDIELTIPKHLVRTFAGSPDYERGVAECVGRGAWREHDWSYEVVHHSDVVRDSLRAQWRKKERDIRAQKAARDRKAHGAVSTDVSTDAGTDASADVSADVSAPVNKQASRQAVMKNEPYVEPVIEPSTGWRLSAVPTTRGTA